MHLQNSHSNKGPFSLASHPAQPPADALSTSQTVWRIPASRNWAKDRAQPRLLHGLLDTLCGLCYVIFNPQYATRFFFSLSEPMSSETRIKMLTLFKMSELPPTLKCRYYYFAFSIQVGKVPLHLPWHSTGQEFGRFRKQGRKLYGIQRENVPLTSRWAKDRNEAVMAGTGDYPLHQAKLSKLQVKYILRTVTLSSTWWHHLVWWLLHRLSAVAVSYLESLFYCSEGLHSTLEFLCFSL